MKATDLMCGDWVLINGIQHKIQAIDSIDAEILADNELYYIGENKYHSEDKIEGIPFTREILEENDWYYKLEVHGQTYKFGIKYPSEIKFTIFIKNVDKFHLEIISNTIYVWFNYLPNNCELNYADVIVPIKYIHDMQHILRLCGLNKLADNFKI